MYAYMLFRRAYGCQVLRHSGPGLGAQAKDHACPRAAVLLVPLAAILNDCLGFLTPPIVSVGGGQARPARPQRTVSTTHRPLGAPRARLAWRLGGFVTNRHD